MKNGICAAGPTDAGVTDKDVTNMDTHAPDEKDNTEEKAGTSSSENSESSTVSNPENEETPEQTKLREKHHTPDDLKLIRELRRFKKEAGL